MDGITKKFKRKQAAPPERNVTSKKQAPVFSYYATQSTNQDISRTSGRHGQKRRGLLRKVLPNIPIGIAIVTIIACIMYASTIDTNKPIVRIVSGSAAEITDTTRYNAAASGYLQEGLFNRSKLLINTKSIEARFKQEFPEVKDVIISIPLVSRRPVISASLEQPAVVVGTPDGGFVLNQEGRVFARSDVLPTSLLKAVPIVEDQAGIVFEIGAVAIPSDLITFITSINRQSNADGLTYSRLVLPTVANELHATPSGKSYFIKYNTERDVRLQVGSYKATVKQLEEQGDEPKTYVDVRIADKVYVR